MQTRINWDGAGWYKEHLISSATIEFRRVGGKRGDKRLINNTSCTWVSKSLRAIAKFDEVNMPTSRWVCFD